MICDELKKSLYLTCFQGKLSKRLSSDSDVSSLLDRIIYTKKLDAKEIKKRKINDENNIPYEIPENWKWVKMGYLCDVIRGLTFSASYKTKKDNTVLVLRGGNIDSKTEELIYDDNIYVDSSIPNDNQYLKDGDILIVASSGTKTSVGKSAYVYNVENNVSFGGFMMVVRPYSEIVNPKYISYQIKMYRNKIISDTNGYISNITNEILNNLMIPLPPIEEQGRIVNKIEELFSKLDEIKPVEVKLNILKKNFAIDMKKSVLNKVLSKYKDTIELDKIAVINGGYAFKSTNYSDEGVRIIRISDFDEYGIKDDNIVRYKYDSSLSPYKLDNDDIIICMTGGTVGKNIILNNIPDDYYTNQRVATIKVNKNYIPKYVYYCINAPYIQQMIQNSKNSTNDNISMPLIKSFPIPNISIEEQNNVIKQIEQFLPLLEEINCLVNEV